MNKQIKKLSELAQKRERKIIGLMSGTSLDGLDIAYCIFDDDNVLVPNFKTIEYNDALRKRLAAIQSVETVNLMEVTKLHRELAEIFGTWVNDCLKEWGIASNEIDIIASHGQTIYHHSELNERATLQIVDGDHIAQKTGIITVSDFRQKHIAVGGEGAPLAALMDQHLFQHNQINRVLLNLGGIANLTWLPSIESGKQVLSTDTGPANTLINEAMTHFFDQSFDNNGQVASSGQVIEPVLQEFLRHPFFEKELPKTTGQEWFNLASMQTYMSGSLSDFEATDVVRTLTELTILSVSRIIQKLAEGLTFELYVSGGGVHNPVIMNGLERELSNGEMISFDQLGFHPDAKEALLMAFLANQCVTGNRFKINDVETNLGKISLPD